MDGILTDVTAGASTAAEVSPASVAPDVGSQTAATEGAQGQPVSTPAPVSAPTAVAESETSVDAGAGEFQIPVTEEELQQAPEQWREKFTSLLNGYKSLEKDHKDFKAQYADLGDAQGVKDSLGLLDGLYGYATDESGNVLYDQQTGLPVPSTSEFISKLQEGSPALVNQLFRDLWSTRLPDGSTQAQQIFKSLGLDPNRLEDYRKMTSDPSHAISSGIVPPDELAAIPEKYQQVYKSLSPSLRYQAQQMDETALDEFLAGQQEVFESRQFRDEYKQQQESQQKAEMAQFWDGVDKSFEGYATKLRRDAFDSIQKGLTSQVQFSADPTINAVQSGAVMGMLANLLDPNLRFATEGALTALGVTLDQGFDDALSGLSQQAYLVKRYEAIAGNPALASYRNDAAMAKAQGEVNRMYQTIQAKFNGIAVKVAKALAGHNQELREAEKSKLEVGARPTIGNGALPRAGPKTPPPGVKPFTPEWLQWSQSQGAGGQE